MKFYLNYNNSRYTTLTALGIRQDVEQIMANMFYSTLLNVFYSCHVFYVVNVLKKFFFWNVFTRKSSYCFQRVLAIAILSVCPSVRPSVCLSVTRVDQSRGSEETEGEKRAERKGV